MTESQSSDVLEPALTKYDQRILAALDQWTEGRDRTENPLEWMTAWQVGEKLGDHDVQSILSTLRGLERLRYVMAKGWHSRARRQRWIATPWTREELD